MLRPYRVRVAPGFAVEARDTLGLGVRRATVCRCKKGRRKLKGVETSGFFLRNTARLNHYSFPQYVRMAARFRRDKGRTRIFLLYQRMTLACNPCTAGRAGRIFRRRTVRSNGFMTKVSRRFTYRNHYRKDPDMPSK